MKVEGVDKEKTVNWGRVGYGLLWNWSYETAKVDVRERIARNVGARERREKRCKYRLFIVHLLILTV